ncbi:hypothetical protein L1887_32866 [Cichorium endivia]|nr:hypothetical protein L1887_32866 [Cichorium endivia]
MSQSNFTSSLPNGFGSGLSFLEELNLLFNQVSGSIPKELGNLSNLRGSVDLSHNFFKGSDGLQFDHGKEYVDTWRLCTVTQVEELKSNHQFASNHGKESVDLLCNQFVHQGILGWENTTCSIPEREATPIEIDFLTVIEIYHRSQFPSSSRETTLIIYLY